MSKSENIKKALNSFLYTEKIFIRRNGAQFRIGGNTVHITNSPYCTCPNFQEDCFCEHVYNLLLIKFKVHVRNKILYKEDWTDEELLNILRKRFRQPSRPRGQRPPRAARRRRNIRNNQPPREQNYGIAPALLEHARRQNNANRRLRHDRRQLHRRRAIYIPHLRIPSVRNADRGPSVPDAPRPRLAHPPNFNPNRPFGRGFNSPSRLHRLRNEEHTCEMRVNNNYNIDEKCSICISSLCDENHITTMCSNCSNHFHDYCIDTWITQRLQTRRYPSCPLCRSIINM